MSALDEQAREALEFYARADTYSVPIGLSAIWGDRGSRARMALERLSKDTDAPEPPIPGQLEIDGAEAQAA